MKLAKKQGRQSSDVFRVGDPVRIQDHVSKRWIQKGVITEARQGDDGSNTSFMIKSETERTLLRHLNHIRLDINSLDKTSETIIQFQEKPTVKEFVPHIEMRITRSKARELSSLALSKKSALRKRSCSPEALSQGGLLGGMQSSPPPPFSTA